MKKNKKITRQKKLIFWTSYLLTAPESQFTGKTKNSVKEKKRWDQWM